MRERDRKAAGAPWCDKIRLGLWVVLLMGSSLAGAILEAQKECRWRHPFQDNTGGGFPSLAAFA
jgi:hypothetical protein